MTRRLLIGLLVALLVIQPATVAAASYPTADAACERTNNETLVGFLPGSSDLDDRQVLTEEEQLYPGTTLRLALCKDGKATPTRGSEWTLSGSSGLEVIDTTDATATVRVTDESDSIDVLELVDEKDGIPALTIEVQHTPTADSELTDEPIAFEDSDNVSAYESAEQEYLWALENVSAATDRFNKSADALDSGDADPEDRTEAVFAEFDKSRESVEATGDQLEDRLYETAWHARGETNAVVALDNAEEREQTAETNARESMQNYLGALERAEQDARSTALFNLGGAALAGLLVGAIPGWKLTASKLADIRFDRQVNSSVTYGPRVLARALVLAAVVGALTVGAVVGLGELGMFGGLL